MDRRGKHSSAPAVLLITAALLLGPAGCGNSTPESAGSTSAPITDGAGAITTSTEVGAVGETFTLDELGRFDGKDGRPAYIAVDGVVYDVSGSASWPEGEHSRCSLGAMAGKDLTQELERAPSNMRALVERLPIVGSLAQ